MKTNHQEAIYRSNLNREAHRARPLRRWCLVATLLLLLLPGAVLAQPCTLRPTNIVAWWPGDGHAYDVINVKAAVLQNGAGYAAGEVCQAFRFDGSNEKVRIPNNTYLRQTNTWTIEAWVRSASFTNSTLPTLCSEGSRTVALGLNQGTGKLESWINNDNANTFLSTTALTLNGSNHVALVRDVDTRTFYINGVAAGSTNLVQPHLCPRWRVCRCGNERVRVGHQRRRSSDREVLHPRGADGRGLRLAAGRNAVRVPVPHFLAGSATRLADNRAVLLPALVHQRQPVLPLRPGSAQSVELNEPSARIAVGSGRNPMVRRTLSTVQLFYRDV